MQATSNITHWPVPAGVIVRVVKTILGCFLASACHAELVISVQAAHALARHVVAIGLLLLLLFLLFNDVPETR